jgi:hypothetical protein
MGRRRLQIVLAFVFVAMVACASSGLTSEDGLPLPPRPEDAAPPPDDGDGGRQADRAIPDAGRDVDEIPGPRVFVTSTASNARLGGVAGADARCAAIAGDAGIGGTWVAWLSIEGGPHAVDRVTSIGPWHTISGGIVAANKGALVGGTLARPIDRDENGADVPPSHVWTGSGPDGRYLTNDCDRWTPGGSRGRVGATDQTTAAWTSTTTINCGLLARLYCFER